MKFLGISCLGHDASMAVVIDSNIIWAAHAERYSGIKNDPFLNQDIVSEALAYGPFDCIVYYERPLIKKIRHFIAGQVNSLFSLKDIPYLYLKQFGIKIDCYSKHHESHAAGGYYTSPFETADILVIDAIGELKTTSFYSDMEQKHVDYYPYSLGLLYSAITARIGLKPNEDEYITMGLAPFGKPIYFNEVMNLLDQNNHRGLGNFLPHASSEDLAASVQSVYETKLLELVELSSNNNLVLSGGCALNCVANSKIKNKSLWIMPNPGDAGSSLGAIANIKRTKLNWINPYLGFDIQGPYPVKEALSELLDSGIVGIANGRAEFGPRSLGNRSLLADPRGKGMQDKINSIKQRQAFRPFAPAILEEYAHEYFDLVPQTSPYMQFVGKVKDPTAYPAITHVDGTARIQTVSYKQNPGFYTLLQEWMIRTGCPMLLNTSLNIKGQPIVNTQADARKFSTFYNVKVV